MVEIEAWPSCLETDVHAFLAELGRVGMAQAVGVDALGHACPSGQFRQPPPYASASQTLPRGRAEDRACATVAVAGTHVEPAFQDGQRAAIDAHDSGLVALAVQNADRAAFEVNVLGVEIERLGDAQAGAVEDRE